MYGRRARYYDAIYHWKNYEQEAARLRQILTAEGIADGARVLEAACGTGTHLLHLSRWYDVSGFDISESMLSIARRKVAAATLFRADMVDLHVDQPFHGLLCLFSSIGYVFPEERLRAAAFGFAQALLPQGVLIIEPWLTPEKFIPGGRSMQTYQDESLNLCRMSIGRCEGEQSILDFHWLAAERGMREVEHFTERHELRMYPTQTLLDVFSEAGFACRFEPDGLMKDRGLIIGRLDKDHTRKRTTLE
jgi:SAM-dependent methyltransferase